MWIEKCERKRGGNLRHSACNLDSFCPYLSVPRFFCPPHSLLARLCLASLFFPALPFLQFPFFLTRHSGGLESTTVGLRRVASAIFLGSCSMKRPGISPRSPLPRLRTLRLARQSSGWRFLAARRGREEHGHARATRPAPADRAAVASFIIHRSSFILPPSLPGGLRRRLVVPFPPSPFFLSPPERPSHCGKTGLLVPNANSALFSRGFCENTR